MTEVKWDSNLSLIGSLEAISMGNPEVLGERDE